LEALDEMEGEFPIPIMMGIGIFISL
jgi:hypothetical protein